MAEITFEGDVHPVSPAGFPVFGGSDADSNGVVDFLFPGGNGIITDGIDQTDPTGAPGGSIGLAWDAPQVWRAYSSPHPVVVGHLSSGSLTISAGGNLRHEHCVVGMEPGSHGTLNVTGFGSLWNSDRDDLPNTARAAIALARGIAPSAVTYNMLFGRTAVGNPYPAVSPMQPGAYNLWCGRKGAGAVNITAGGRVVVRNRLLVGGYEPVEDTEMAGGGSPKPLHPDTAGPINPVQKIVSPGDAATFLDGPGGVLILDGIGSAIYVVGKTGSNASPYPTKKTDGTTAEQNTYNANINETAMTAAQSPDSVIGQTSMMMLRSGAAAFFGGGLINRGVLVAGGAGANPGTALISFKPAIPPAVATLTNNGLIYVRSGTTLAINGDIANEGEICVEPGAQLELQGTVSGNPVRFSTCSSVAYFIEAGLIRFDPERVVDFP
jgi:hypothetical protein